MNESMKMKIIECKDCHFTSPPPFPLCPSCGSENFLEKQIDGSGSIFTYTIVRMGFGELEKNVPYVLAIIETNEGMKMTTVLTGDVDLDSVKIGDRVCYSHTQEGVGPLFKLV